jgi:hypothetical protein
MGRNHSGARCGCQKGPADGADYESRTGEPARVARILREGDVIEHEGLNLEVLHAPGGKSPLPTIAVTRAFWRKIYEKSGVEDADAREARDPRQYSVVSVNAMLLDLSRRNVVKCNSDREWELASSAVPLPPHE